VYRFGECTIDTQRHQLHRAGQRVRLRAKAFQLLCYLLAQRHRTVLKQELYEQVWPQSFISEATLESTLRAVRQAIGDSGRAQQLTEAVYGYGYRFPAPVEELADPPAEREDKALGMRPDAMAVHREGASAVASVPPAQGPAVDPDGREGRGGRDQEG